VLSPGEACENTRKTSLSIKTERYLVYIKRMFGAFFYIWRWMSGADLHMEAAHSNLDAGSGGDLI
jgi:HAMP domain-containing protein